MAVTCRKGAPGVRLNELGPLARREASFRGSNLKLAGYRWGTSFAQTELKSMLWRAASFAGLRQVIGDTNSTRLSATA